MIKWFKANECLPVPHNTGFPSNYVLTRDKDARYQIGFYNHKTECWKICSYPDGKAIVLDPASVIEEWAIINQ